MKRKLQTSDFDKFFSKKHATSSQMYFPCNKKTEKEISEAKNDEKQHFFILTPPDIAEIFTQRSLKSCKNIERIQTLFKYLHINPESNIYDCTCINELLRDSGTENPVNFCSDSKFNTNYNNFERNKLFNNENKTITEKNFNSTEFDDNEQFSCSFIDSKNKCNKENKIHKMNEDSENSLLQNKNIINKSKDFNKKSNYGVDEKKLVCIYRSYSGHFYGRNISPNKQNLHILQTMLSHFLDPSILLLFFAGILSISIGVYKYYSENDTFSWIEGTCMIGAVFVIVLINTYTEIYLQILFNRLNNKDQINANAKNFNNRNEANIEKNIETITYMNKRSDESNDKFPTSKFEDNKKIKNAFEQEIDKQDTVQNIKNTKKEKSRKYENNQDFKAIKYQDIDDTKIAGKSIIYNSANLFTIDGITLIESSEIVVGDVIYLRAGDVVPADCMIISEGCYKTCGDNLKNTETYFPNIENNKITTDNINIQPKTKFIKKSLELVKVIENNNVKPLGQEFKNLESKHDLINSNVSKPLMKKVKRKKVISSNCKKISNKNDFYDKIIQSKLSYNKKMCTHSEVFTDESMLFGGSTNTPKSYLDPLLFDGTYIVDGETRALVLAVGINTHKNKVINKITPGSQNKLSKKKSPLENKVEEFTRNMARKSLYIGLFLILAHLAKIVYQVFQKINLETNGLNSDSNHNMFSNQSIWSFKTTSLINIHMISVTFIEVISIVVMSIPEGLPMALTLTLAVAITRMLEEHILVKNISVCEMMNDVSVIVTDKTGTLTHNEMCARYVYTGSTNKNNLSDQTNKKTDKNHNNHAKNINENKIEKIYDGKDVLNYKNMGNFALFKDSNLLHHEEINKLKQASMNYINDENCADTNKNIPSTTDENKSLRNSKFRSNDNKFLTFKGNGYIRKIRCPKNPSHTNLFNVMGEMAVLNTILNSSAFESNGKFVGSMNESIFLRIAKEKNIDYKNIRKENKVILKTAFSSKRGYMASAIKTKNGYIVFFKGDPEKIALHCNKQHSQQEYRDISVKKDDHDSKLKNLNDNNSCSNKNDNNDPVIYNGNYDKTNTSMSVRQSDDINEDDSVIIKNKHELNSKFKNHITDKNVDIAEKLRAQENYNLNLAKKNLIKNENHGVDIKPSYEITNFDKESLLKFTRVCYRKCYRTLVLAYVRIPQIEPNSTILGTNKLTFLCAIGMEDPVRTNITKKMHQCISEGLRVVLLTGDKALMASHISKKIGIVTKNPIYYKEKSSKKNKSDKCNNKFLDKYGKLSCKRDKKDQNFDAKLYGNSCENKVENININNAKCLNRKKVKIDAENIDDDTYKNDYCFNAIINNSTDQNKPQKHNKDVNDHLYANNIIKEPGMYLEYVENTEEKENKDLLLTGHTLRHISDEKLSKIIEEIKVVARASPFDKQRFVYALQKNGNMVAVTGDGANDGPALKQADIGFALESGTDIAREAASIILLDNDFGNIIRCIHWARIVNKNIRRYIQFQIVTTFCTVIVAGGMSFFVSGENKMFNPLKLLWINIVMDMFFVISLVTDRPIKKEKENAKSHLKKQDGYENLKNVDDHKNNFCLECSIILNRINGINNNDKLNNDRYASDDISQVQMCGNFDREEPMKHYKKQHKHGFEPKKKENINDKISEPLITNEMKIFIGISSIYQCIVILILVYMENKSTFLFNTFLYLQLFTQLNARSIIPSLNPFKNIHMNLSFWTSNFIVIIIQYIITNKLNVIFKTSPLSTKDMLMSICIAGTIIPFIFIVRFYIYRRKCKNLECKKWINN